jgi:predicted membrane protein
MSYRLPNATTDDSLMLLSRLILLRTASEISYLLLLLTALAAVGLSCFALLSQAVRTAPNQSWVNNINAFVIGASYAIVVTPNRFTAVIIFQ